MGRLCAATPLWWAPSQDKAPQPTKHTARTARLSRPHAAARRPATQNCSNQGHSASSSWPAKLAGVGTATARSSSASWSTHGRPARQACCASTAVGWRRRWWSLLSVAVQDSVATTALPVQSKMPSAKRKGFASQAAHSAETRKACAEHNARRKAQGLCKPGGA